MTGRNGHHCEVPPWIMGLGCWQYVYLYLQGRLPRIATNPKFLGANAQARVHAHTHTHTHNHAEAHLAGLLARFRGTSLEQPHQGRDCSKASDVPCCLPRK